MGEKLKQARERAGLTQVQLAEKVGCHQKDIARWEAGREPKALTLKKLAQALGCSMDDLV
jgi:transcriptional regulator with XRE-family HTH domain